jgi:hypothetical protein
MTFDEKIECLTCHDVFTWTAREIEQYRDRGWQRPLRCVRCREHLRQQRERDRLGSLHDDDEAAKG